MQLAYGFLLASGTCVLQVNIIVGESLAFGQYWLGPLVKIVRAMLRLYCGVGGAVQNGVY